MKEVKEVDEKTEDDDETHEKDSVFYYHNPMLALGLIEMQVQNVLRSRTLDAEILEEPDLEKKPDLKADPSAPKHSRLNFLYPTADQMKSRGSA